MGSDLAEDVMGYGLMIDEEAELYHYWAYLAHLLGIDPRLVQGLSSSTQAERVDNLLEATTGPPLPESALLAEKTLHGVADEIRKAFHIPSAPAVDLMEAIARRFHGDRVADALRIPRHGVADRLLSPVISLTRDSRERLRKHPDRGGTRRSMTGSRMYVSSLRKPRPHHLREGRDG